MGQFIYVPDARARMVRIDNGMYQWLFERTIRDKAVLRKVQKHSQEPYFSSFEEGSRYVFNEYLNAKSKQNPLTNIYKVPKTKKR